MPRKLLEPAVFLIGLAVLCWVGAGYVASSALALCVVLLVTACYLAGALELRRFRQATAGLNQAVTALATHAPDDLRAWLQDVPAPLRSAVRQRVEGERVPLPAPALTPYLVGLLVLLGMLGTLLGMTSTLRGAGAALQGAADLDAMRASLAAPVKGLAFAFGTSIAGVATSAMLGLLSALCRRERADALHALDIALAGPLHVHSRAHRREQGFALLQRQADATPVLVEQLQAAMQALVQHGREAHERQLAQQTAFHAQAAAAQAQHAAALQASLSVVVADSARATREVLQPVVESMADALARHAASLREELLQATRQHLETLATRHEASNATVSALWTDAVQQQRDANSAGTAAMHETLDRFASAFDTRATRMVDDVAAKLGDVTTRLGTGLAAAASAWTDAATQQRDTNSVLADQLRDSLEDFNARFDERATGLVAGVATRLDGVAAQLETGLASAAAHWLEAARQQRETGAELAQDLRESLGRFNSAFDERATALQQQLAQRFDAATERAGEAWAQALARQQALAEALAQDQRGALGATTASLGSLATSLMDTVQRSNTELQASLQAQAGAASGLMDAAVARLEAASAHAAQAWRDALERQATGADAAAIRNEQALTQAAETMQAHGEALVRDLQRSHVDLQASLGAQAAQHSRGMLEEIGRLVHDAAEAPKAAARVIAELRESLAASMARDNDMLAERGRLLATVDTLLGAVNHASLQQREAVEALVTTSADALQQVASRFGEQVDANAARLDAAADRITAGHVEAASLGDVFSAALHGFGESNERLLARLGSLEDTLGQAMARSDEQLAYYVAQAREVVDLSVLAQKQIIGELQQLARRNAELQGA